MFFSSWVRIRVRVPLRVLFVATWFGIRVRVILRVMFFFISIFLGGVLGLGVRIMVCHLGQRRRGRCKTAKRQFDTCVTSVRHGAKRKREIEYCAPVLIVYIQRNSASVSLTGPRKVWFPPTKMSWKCKDFF